MYVKLVNRILLGLLMLVPGLLKLFIIGPTAITGMLAGLGFPIPLLFAWILILAEIVFGIAILAKWKLEYTTWPPIVILVVAALVTLPWADLSKIQVPTLLFHLVAASNYWLIGDMARHKAGMQDMKHAKR